MPQVMPAEIRDAGPGQRHPERLGLALRHRRSLVGEHIGVMPADVPPDHLGSDVVQRD